MKKHLFSILTIISLGLAACGSDHQPGTTAPSESTSGEAKAHGASKEFTSAYICPMHCEGSGSEQAGKCPVCEMDYVLQAEHVKDGHNH
jgi:Heavy metal binding domain